MQSVFIDKENKKKHKEYINTHICQRKYLSWVQVVLVWLLYKNTLKNEL